MNQELLLPKNFKSFPVKELRVSSRTLIEKYLNDRENCVVDCDSKLMNNYIGLAELVGFSNEQITFISSKENPTAALFELWEQSDLEPRLGKLWEYLIELKRFDILKECRSPIGLYVRSTAKVIYGREKLRKKEKPGRDVDAYLKVREKHMDSYCPIQDMEVTSRDDHHVIETLTLTKGDVDAGTPQYYDAFVCHSGTDRDLRFIHEMIHKLEKERGLKLCVPSRDDLPGAASYVIDAELIKSRCRMMIIILSNDYLRSSACEFQVKFATALSPRLYVRSTAKVIYGREKLRKKEKPDTQRKRIVPVLIESMVIPDVIRHMSLCDFTKKDLMKFFWDRLSRSLLQPIDSNWNTCHSDTQSDDDTVSERIITLNDLNSPGIVYNIRMNDCFKYPPEIHHDNSNNNFPLGNSPLKLSNFTEHTQYESFNFRSQSPEFRDGIHCNTAKGTVRYTPNIQRGDESGYDYLRKRGPKELESNIAGNSENRCRSPFQNSRRGNDDQTCIQPGNKEDCTSESSARPRMISRIRSSFPDIEFIKKMKTSS